MRIANLVHKQFESMQLVGAECIIFDCLGHAIVGERQKCRWLVCYGGLCTVRIDSSLIGVLESREVTSRQRPNQIIDLLLRQYGSGRTNRTDELLAVPLCRSVSEHRQLISRT